MDRKSHKFRNKRSETIHGGAVWVEDKTIKKDAIHANI